MNIIQINKQNTGVINLQTLLSNNDKNLRINIQQNLEVIIHDDALEKANLEIEFVIEQNAKLNYVLNAVDTSCNIQRLLKFNLLGEQSEAHSKYFFFGRKTQKILINTVQEHIAANTKSSVNVKCVLSDKAELRCDNLIHIKPTAHKSLADQNSKCIIFSKTSRAIAIPKLKIENNQVKCQHGAAISRFNEDQLFYLASRGLDKKSAQKSLIAAFLK
jgi:Fe-S cluster assembly protein SufD